MVLAGHEEEGLDLGRELAVRERHLELVLEVAVGAEAAQDDAGADRAAEVDEHALHHADLDVAERARGLAGHLDALRAREEGAGLPLAGGDGEDDAVEDAARALDQVEVAERDRVERPGVDDETGGFVLHDGRGIYHKPPARRKGAFALDGAPPRMVESSA